MITDAANLLLPATHQLKKPAVKSSNIMLIASTNRPDSLDPALMRPGRFDQRLTFDRPDKAGRRELIAHFLARKAHAPELDDPQRREALAAVTQGYSPAMLEGMFDEALINAVQEDRRAMTWFDVEHARLDSEIGLGQPVLYTDHEAKLIATHESGHATIAWLVAPGRRLEVLSIIKRRSALGLLAHGDREEVYLQSRSELLGLIAISMGGQSAEELFFGDISTGPSGDLLAATRVAASMVGSCGMEGLAGLVWRCPEQRILRHQHRRPRSRRQGRPGGGRRGAAATKAAGQGFARRQPASGHRPSRCAARAARAHRHRDHRHSRAGATRARGARHPRLRVGHGSRRLGFGHRPARTCCPTGADAGHRAAGHPGHATAQGRTCRIACRGER